VREICTAVSISAGPKTLSNQSQSQASPAKSPCAIHPYAEINCARCVKGKSNKTVRLLRRQSAHASSLDIGLAGTRGMTKINNQIALTLPIAAEEN